jgi:ATP-binding cassette subfamily B protein
MKYIPASVVKKRAALMRRMLGVSWHNRPYAVMSFLVGAVLETGSFILGIYATAKVASLLATYVAHGGDTGQIWFWIWIDIISGALVGIGMWLMSYAKRLLYFKTVYWATVTFQRALCTIDIADFFDTKVRDQLNKASDGYSWQASNFSESVLDLIYAIFRFLATAVVVSQISWWIIPLLALFLIPSLYLEGKLARVQWFVWETHGDSRHMFWGMQYILRGAKSQMELRSSQAGDYIVQKIERMTGQFYSEQESKLRRSSRYLLPAQLLEVGGTAVGSLFVLRQFLAGAIGLDRYFFLSGALLRISGALTNIFGTLTRMQQSFLFIEDFFAILDRKPRMVDKLGAVQLQSKTAPDIVFEHISFTYPGQTEAVFTDLSFTIRSGERLAIVGENGAGKSTLIKLLLRFYKPDSGHILVGGIDLQDIAIESWYDQLATLFQDLNQYPFPISENIEIARSEYAGDNARLLHASELSNVDAFVDRYTHGWDTVLDNSFSKGVEPSGGQWQRVALARAFYRQANVLILDEPTAAIDAKAEYDIFNNIFKEYEGKTAIIVSHRFSTVRKADRILVFEHGKVIEDGSHKELMRINGQYADMFNKQAEGYR